MDKMFCTYFLFFFRKKAAVKCRRSEAVGTRCVYHVGAGWSTPTGDKHPVSRARAGTWRASFVRTFALLQQEGFAVMQREKSCSSASFSKLFAWAKQRASASDVVETRAEVKDGETGKAGMK